MAIVESILISLGWVLLSGGLCYGVVYAFFKQAGFALAVAGLVSFWMGFADLNQRLWVEFPPVDASFWWLYGLPLLAGIALIYRSGKAPQTIWALPLGLSSAAYLYGMTTPLRQYEWTLTHSALFSLGAGALMGVFLLGVAKAFDQHVQQPLSPYVWPVFMGVLSLGSAGLFLLGSSAVYHQQALFLAVFQFFTGGLFCFRFAGGTRAFSTGLVMSQFWLLLMLWANVLVFASLSYWALCLFGSVVLLLGIRQTSLKDSIFRQLISVSLGSGLCLALAIVMVWLYQPQAEIYF